MHQALFFLLVLLILATVTAMADITQIASYVETVEYQENGQAQVTIRFTSKEPLEKDFLLPCSYKNAENAILVQPVSGTVELPTVAGVPLLGVPVSTEIPAFTPIVITYTASGAFKPEDAKKKDFGNIDAKYLFVHTVPSLIDSFAVRIILAPGLQFKAVDEYQPKLAKDDPNDPYEYGITDKGLRSVSLTAQNMKIGDRAMLKWRMCPERRPMGLFIGLILAALAYLVCFQDLIKKPNTPIAPAEKNE